jgi:hypothetical protein
MPSRTIIAASINLLFQVLAAADVVNVELETQLAVTGGLVALAEIFQRLAIRKAERAARGQIVP